MRAHGRVVPGGSDGSERPPRAHPARAGRARAGRRGVARAPAAVLGRRRDVPLDGLEPRDRRRPPLRGEGPAARPARDGHGPRGALPEADARRAGSFDTTRGFPCVHRVAGARARAAALLREGVRVPGRGRAVREAVRHARPPADERRVPRPRAFLRIPGAAPSRVPGVGAGRHAERSSWRASRRCTSSGPRRRSSTSA